MSRALDSTLQTDIFGNYGASLDTPVGRTRRLAFRVSVRGRLGHDEASANNDLRMNMLFI